MKGFVALLFLLAVFSDVYTRVFCCPGFQACTVMKVLSGCRLPFGRQGGCYRDITHAPQENVDTIITLTVPCVLIILQLVMWEQITRSVKSFFTAPSPEAQLHSGTAAAELQQQGAWWGYLVGEPHRAACSDLPTTGLAPTMLGVPPPLACPPILACLPLACPPILVWPCHHWPAPPTHAL